MLTHADDSADSASIPTVTYAIQHLDQTGRMRAPYQVLRGFTASGWDASITTVASDANAGIHDVWGHVPVERVGRMGSRRLRIVQLALRMLVRHRSELVFSFVWDWHNYGLLLARIIRRSPFVICLDTYCYQAAWDTMTWKARTRALVRYGLALKNADLVLAETPTTAQHAEKIARKGRVRLIPFSLWRRDLLDYERQWAAAGDGLEREPVVLYAGRIVRRKNLHDLIEAFANVQPLHPTWRMEIMGPSVDQDYRRELVEMIVERDLEGVIRFVPPRFGGDLYRRLRTTSVFALPSTGEGLPTAITEAMYFGGAIVAARSGAVPYQLDEGSCGLLHEPGDVDDLVACLDALISSMTDREQLMSAARQRMIEHFCWETHFPALEAECREIIADRDD